MTFKAAIACLISSNLLVQAVPHLSPDHNGQPAIEHEYIRRDTTSVTLRHANGRDVITPIDRLSADDRAWLEKNHPLTCATVPPQSAVFDQLVFGDTREQVLTKLKASKFVELVVDESLIGRTGFNGVFHTRKKIGGLTAALYFDWTPEGQLKELTLQTETLRASDYRTLLMPSWQDFIQLLTTLYGKPSQSGSFPTMDTIADGTFSPSHLWALDGIGSALLGTARDGDKYQVVVRFTQKKIQPAYLPEPPPGAGI
jgi:hypothetical protein